MKTKLQILVACFAVMLFYSFTQNDNSSGIDQPVSNSVNSFGYPTGIDSIMINKCSNAGCHTTLSVGAAGGFNLSSWDSMFKGGVNGSPIVPYSPDYSYCLYFVNTDTSLGLALKPTMPDSLNPLSKTEYLALKNWIANGAPDNTGFVKFSDNPKRKKFYVCIQACDLVAVFDADSRQIMRYVSVGVDPAIESPHQVKISPDGKYWCVAFYTGHVLQIFNASNDSLVNSVEIGSGLWTNMAFTPDSKTVYVTSLDQFNSKIAPVDLTTFTHGSDITAVSSPHGGYVTKDGNFLYLTSQYGNFIYKITLTGASKGDVNPIQIKTTSPNADPHEIAFTPDESKYFVSCQNSNEVRVFNTASDTLLAVLPVGTRPQEFSLSLTHPYLFVTCTEDVIDPFSKGSVYVFNYQTLQLVPTGQSLGLGKIYPGYQPHGIAVDDDHNVVYVANLNSDPAGPAPHYATPCGGRDGWISIIDMNTLDLLIVNYPSAFSLPYKNEVPPFPYSIAYRSGSATNYIADPLHNENGIFVYPNPSNGKFSIVFNQPMQNARLNLFNVTGEKIFSENFSGKIETVNLKLSQGIYFAQILSGNNKWTRKIIVE